MCSATMSTEAVARQRPLQAAGANAQFQLARAIARKKLDLSSLDALGQRWEKALASCSKSRTDRAHQEPVSRLRWHASA
jgi:hypothetical protein